MARLKQETLVLFPEILTITQKFTDEQFGILMRAAFTYRICGEVYSGDDAAVDVAFQVVANQIDRYRNYCDTLTNNAKGNKVKQKSAKQQQSDTPYPNPIQSYPGPNESMADKPPTRSKFSPPSVDEVNMYCQEKGLSIDAQRFVDYYESNGWMVGRNKMKDWRAAVRNWGRKGNTNSGKTELEQVWPDVGTTV